MCLPKDLHSRTPVNTDNAALLKFFKDITPANNELYKKVMKAKNPALRFQIVWWHIIGKLLNKQQWLDYLANNGFKPPAWVDYASGSSKGPFPIQWGNLGVTCEAVALLFDVYITYYKQRPNYAAKLLFDKASFQATVQAACTRLYGERAIAQTIKQVTDNWQGLPNLTERFVKVLKATEFKKVSINHYRADSYPSGKYADARGCIAPKIFDSLSKEKSKKLAKNLQSDPYPRSQSNNYNNNSNYNNHSNYSNLSNNYNNGRRGIIGRFQGYRNNRNYNNYAIPTIPNTSSMSLYNTIYADIAPSGIRLPSKKNIRTPATKPGSILYAPKIKYFADAIGCTEVPRDDKAYQEPDEYFTSLGHVPPFYCADFQSNTCSKPNCHFYHICEWCAGSHIGNNCRYRPSLPLRGNFR